MAKDKNGKELPKGISYKTDKDLYMGRFMHQGQQVTHYDRDLKTLKKRLADAR